MLLLAGLASACTLLSGPDDDVDSFFIERLRQREASWDSLGVHDYDFDYAKSCVCPSATGQVRIEVRGDAVTRVTDEAGKDLTAETAKQWPTVDSLFARARAALADERLTVEIQYDSAWFFPRSIQLFASSSGSLIRHTAGGLARVVGTPQ